MKVIRLENEQIALIISIISVAIVVFNFINGRKKDVESDTANFTKVNMKLDEICRSTNEIRLDAKTTAEEVKKLAQTQIKHDEEIKALWRNVDDLKGQLK